MSEHILGRTILQALSINKMELRAAAGEKVGSSLDLAHLDGFQRSLGGIIARILNEGIYHRDRDMTSYEYDDEGEAWSELGQDREKEVDNAILNALKKAEYNGI